MHGRFTLSTDLKKFAEHLAVQYDPKQFTPSFNICPSQSVAVILNDGNNRITQARWGLIPRWSKDPSVGNRLTNAPAESIEITRNFRESFQHRRCIVLADGFYEWGSRPGQKLEIPHYFRMTNKEVFAFAGLWDVWCRPKSRIKFVTVCLITTEANQIVEPIHDRMPVILDERQYELWLSTEKPSIEKLKECLQPYPADKMESYAVSTVVDSPQHNDADCIEPVEVCS